MTRPVLVSLLVSLLIFGMSCIPSPRRRPAHLYPGRSPGQPGAVGQQQQAAAPAVQLSSDPGEAMGQVTEHLRAQGYQATGPAVSNMNMQQGGVVAYAVDARRGTCYSAVAVAQQGTDLNMVVLDPHGRTITYNVQPDPYPWAAFCPFSSGRYVVRLQMARGAGQYYYASFSGPHNRSPNLAAFFGGAQQGGAAAQTAQIDATTSQRLAAMDQAQKQAGFDRTAEPQGVVMRDNEARNYQLNLQQGTCYRFATLAGPGASDTDVFVVDGAGTELAKDTRQGPDSLVQFCPPNTGAYSLRTLLYEGNGPVFVAAYSQRGQEQEEQVMATESSAGATMEENFRLLDADMLARGYEGLGETSSGELDQGQTREFPISLEGGKCYAIRAVGDNSVRNLDLMLLNASGEQLDRDAEEDPRPIVRVCPKDSGDFLMRVTMHSGQGRFIYAQYKWPRGTRGPFGLRDLMYVRLAEVSSLLGQEGFEPDPSYTPEKGRLRGPGQKRSHNLRLRGGTCYNVLVVGGQGVDDLDVALMDGNTELSSDGSRNAFPSVRHCPDDTKRIALKVEAKAGSGEYFYQVFKRAD